ncbi:MAG: PhzF family phenazine biosynthesis protein [Acidobacteria bacterium]|nr:PhzF family phenazine biosynthesis protein [Acidobacteriota bacterium]
MDSLRVGFSPRLWWVDAFIGPGERGNPAVVVLLEAPLETPEMQQIAFELGVSETAFLHRVGDAWSLRWFTPTVEVDLCGHATIASVHVLASELGVPAGEITFQTRSGPLRGRRLDAGLVAVDLPRSYLEEVDVSTLRGALGEVKEVWRAGASSVLAVVEDYDTLCGLRVDALDLFTVPASLVIAVSEGGPGVDLALRVFAPRLGLAEDPVTGSAMCSLAPWWASRTGQPTVSVRQASSRGGLMHARLFERAVEVAGEARTFFSGELRV